MTALGPIRADDFTSIRNEAIQECYMSGVRLAFISEYFGVCVQRISQLATPAMRKIRRQEIERRETAVIARRLGELKLRLDRGSAS